jgi:hypothetical protein
LGDGFGDGFGLGDGFGDWFGLSDGFGAAKLLGRWMGIDTDG